MNDKRKFLRIVLGGIIANVFFAGIVVSFYAFFIKPSYEKLKAAKEEFASLEQKQSTLWTLEREIESRKNDLDRFDTAFLNADKAVSFVSLLEHMANVSSTVLTISTASLNEKEKDAPGHSSFTILIRGSIPGLMQFITMAENMPYFTEITALSISAQGGQPSANIQLEVKTL